MISSICARNGKAAHNTATGESNRSDGTGATWDRYSKNDEYSSAWLRVSQGLADKAKEEFVTRLAKYLSINDSSTLNALIEQASSFGFSTEKDVSQYSELAVVHGARIERPELQAILSKPDMPTGRR